MNTHDLRYIKTEKILKEAFFRLNAQRKKYTLAQLCQEALINKTTFYKHYETLEDFEYKIRKEYLKNLLLQCEHLYDAFTDTRNYVLDLQNILANNIQTVEIMFNGNPNQISQILEEISLEIYSDKISTKEERLKLIFASRGSSSILIQDFNPSTNEYIIHLLSTVMKA